jgi:uncharacterized membrane protein
MTFTEVMETVAHAFEAAVVIVLVLGLLWSVARAATVWRTFRSGYQGYIALRETFGGVLLVGLEILVAADLIRTVAVQPSLENVAALGLIVLIRTFLSYSLEVEIEGVPPWRRGRRRGVTAEGSQHA